jgi:hypothetical protein
MIFCLLKENADNTILLITGIGIIISLTSIWIILRKRINEEYLNKEAFITVKERNR